VYQINGYDLGSGNVVQYSDAGIFTANGSGTITSATDDFTTATSGGVSTATATGTYHVGSDGRGVITLNFPGGGNLTWDISLASASKIYMIEADAANASGVAEKQTSITLPATATAFVFKQHSVSATQDFSAVGQLTLDTDGSVTGSTDVNRGGTINGGAGTTNPLPLTNTSTFSAPDATGRGTAKIVDSTGTTNFFYYIVDANNIRLLTSDTGVVGFGRVEAQTGGPFSTDPLSGKSFAFGSRGDDNGGIGAANTVGSFTANAGAIDSGSLDTVQDDNSFFNIALNTGGTYSTVAANGRTVVSLSTAIPSTLQQALWMVSPSRAFTLTLSDSNNASKIEDGTADQQQGTFTNSIVTGQYAFTMDGFDDNAGAFIDRVGWIQFDGAGGLKWNEDANSSGSINSPGPLSGSYTVGSNGRATATVNSLSYANNDIVFYLISGSDAYILENDPGVEINGFMTKQTQ
jgi:hypothetical protein